MPGPAASLIAHQGGWDEILFVLAPIALFAGLLALANKRAATALADREHDDAGDVDGAGRARDDHEGVAAPEERRSHRRPPG